MSCIFCDRADDIPLRIFYENKKIGWYAVLSSLPYTKGHSVLVAAGGHGHCPQQFDRKILGTVGIALSDVVEAIRWHYSIDEVLVVSIRREVKHFHIHLLPVWPEEEKRWRKVTGYSTSHLMEYLGSLERKRHVSLSERIARTGESREAQHQKSTETLQRDIQALRKRLGYRPARK